MIISAIKLRIYFHLIILRLFKLFMVSFIFACGGRRRSYELRGSFLWMFDSVCLIVLFFFFLLFSSSQNGVIQLMTARTISLSLMGTRHQQNWQRNRTKKTTTKIEIDRPPNDYAHQAHSKCKKFIRLIRRWWIVVIRQQPVIWLRQLWADTNWTRAQIHRKRCWAHRWMAVARTAPAKPFVQIWI